MCFLNSSKAFDHVNHTVLFKKLINRGVPGYIIKILVFWYANQQMCVRWGSHVSESNNVSITIKVGQGGILSPYLFSVYIDGLYLLYLIVAI